MSDTAIIALISVLGTVIPLVWVQVRLMKKDRLEADLAIRRMMQHTDAKLADHTTTITMLIDRKMQANHMELQAAAKGGGRIAVEEYKKHQSDFGELK